MNRLPLVLATALAASPLAAAPVELMFGPADGRHVTFTFSDDRTASDALVIETRRAGNPGAEIMIWIDRSPDPLASMILTEEDCAFDDGGAFCRLVIDGRSPDYDRFVTAFRLGRTAHVELRNANLAEMQDDISLDGFTAAYGG